MTKTPDVSVIMVACNQGDWVRKTVPRVHESLGSHSREVIVVDDVSTDKCCHGLGQTAIVVNTRGRTGVSQSRRLGFELSKGQVIVWSDPHCEYPHQCLSTLVDKAKQSDAIWQPRTKHNALRRKSHAGSKLVITERGLVTAPVQDKATHPALYNTIYASKREVYEYVGGWPALPGWWGYSEQALSLAAMVRGVPIEVCEEALGIHHLYQQNRQFPYSMPFSQVADNAHWVHHAFFPKTYKHFWLPKLTRHFGNDPENTKHTGGHKWRVFRNWIQDNRKLTEKEVYETILSMSMPMPPSKKDIAIQRPRSEAREHRAAHKRTEKAIAWMKKTMPCRKGCTVLDLGTRDGFALTQFVKLGARQVHGIELVPETAAYAQKQTGYPVDACDMRALPFSEDTWHVVSCIHALEHVPDPQSVVQEMVRVCRPGGWLFVVVPIEEAVRRQYAHFVNFPTKQSLIDLFLNNDQLDATTIRCEAFDQDVKPEFRLVVRKLSVAAHEKLDRPLEVHPVPKDKPEAPTEARFATRNNPDCHNVKLWSSWDGDSTEVEVADLLAGLVRGLQPTVVVETGGCEGRTAEVMGRAVQHNGHGVVYSIEIDKERHRVARKRCLGLPVVCICGDSLEWEPPDDNPIHFAYFDSRHRLRPKEFKRYRPYMTLHTVVAFHDTSPKKGSRRIVEELKDEGWIEPVYLPTPRGIAICRVVK